MVVQARMAFPSVEGGHKGISHEAQGIDDNNAALFRSIKAGAYDFPSDEWDHVSDEAKDLIEKMLVVNPSERMDISDIMKHPWMTKENLEDKVLPKTLAQLKKFNARRKFKAGVMVARVAISRTHSIIKVQVH